MSAAVQLELALGPMITTPKKKRSLSSATVAKRSRIELRQMIQTDSWDDANPHHMVSLFNYCHKAVYGMHVLDLEGKEWFAASSKVKKFVKDFFDDDYAELVKFIRWTWNREKHREAFRKQNGKKTNFFLNWRTQFSAKHLTAYRILKHRKIAGS